MVGRYLATPTHVANQLWYNQPHRPVEVAVTLHMHRANIPVVEYIEVPTKCLHVPIYFRR